MQSKSKQRFMEHLKSQGKLPKSMDLPGMADGGYVQNDDEWSDDDWNDHDDGSGVPVSYNEHYMYNSEPKEGFAFGGVIKAKEVATAAPSLHGNDYGRPNYDDPAENSEDDVTLSDEEIKSRMARAVQAKKYKY